MKILLLSPWENVWVKYFKKFFDSAGHTLTFANKVDYWQIVQYDVLICGWADHLAEAVSTFPKLCDKYICFIRSYEFYSSIYTKVNWKLFDKCFVLNDFILRHIPEVTDMCSVEKINNGIDLDLFPFKERMSGNQILFLADINHKKGIPLLLQIAWKYPLYDIHIRGNFQEPRFGHYLLNKMPSNILVHTYTKDIVRAMENINYILCTSPAEGNPNNLIEGMACGIKPIIHKYLGYENQFPEECCYSRIDEIQNILRKNRYGR